MAFAAGFGYYLSLSFTDRTRSLALHLAKHCVHHLGNNSAAVTMLTGLYVRLRYGSFSFTVGTKHAFVYLHLLLNSVHNLLKGKFHTDSYIAAPLYPLAASAAAKTAEATKTAAEMASENIPELAENILHRESAAAKTACTCRTVNSCVAETVVTLFLVGIAQHIICLGSLLELLLGFLVSRILVGMIFDGHFPVGLLYLFCRGILANSKDLIIISFCHNALNSYNYLGKSDNLAIKGVALLGYIKNLVLLLRLLYRELRHCLVEICIQLLAHRLYR